MKNPPPGAPSGGSGSATQPVQPAPVAPQTAHQAHRPGIAPGLFIVAAGFLILGFAQAAVAYMVFTRVTLNLTRGSQVGYAAGFFIAGAGLVIMAMMQARAHSR
jgi:hypothetical protein